jgi:Rrf2 family protein
MKLNHSSIYAMQALIHMAGQEDNPIVASQHVAEARQIPEKFLLKLLRPLVAVGLPHSVKRPHGGYRLARPAKSITLLEIVEAADGPIRGQAPEVEGAAAFNRRLAEVCDAAADATRKDLGKVRLSDLAGAG